MRGATAELSVNRVVWVCSLLVYARYCVFSLSLYVDGPLRVQEELVKGMNEHIIVEKITRQRGIAKRVRGGGATFLAGEAAAEFDEAHAAEGQARRRKE